MSKRSCRRRLDEASLPGDDIGGVIYLRAELAPLPKINISAAPGGLAS